MSTELDQMIQETLTAINDFVLTLTETERKVIQQRDTACQNDKCNWYQIPFQGLDKQYLPKELHNNMLTLCVTEAYPVVSRFFDLFHPKNSADELRIKQITQSMQQLNKVKATKPITAEGKAIRKSTKRQLKSEINQYLKSSDLTPQIETIKRLNDPESKTVIEECLREKTNNEIFQILTDIRNVTAKIKGVPAILKEELLTCNACVFLKKANYLHNHLVHMLANLPPYHVDETEEYQEYHQLRDEIKKIDYKQHMTTGFGSEKCNALFWNSLIHNKCEYFVFKDDPYHAEAMMSRQTNVQESQKQRIIELQKMIDKLILKNKRIKKKKEDEIKAKPNQTIINNYIYISNDDEPKNISGITDQRNLPDGKYKILHLNEDSFSANNVEVETEACIKNGSFDGKIVSTVIARPVNLVPQNIKSYSHVIKDGAEVANSWQITYKNGDIYEGEVKDLMPDGRGKKTYSDGYIDDGEWEKGVFNIKKNSRIAIIKNTAYLLLSSKTTDVANIDISNIDDEHNLPDGNYKIFDPKMGDKAWYAKVTLKEGKKNGPAVLNVSVLKHETYTYKANYRDGQSYGPGICILESNAINKSYTYIGECRNKRPEGRGTATFLDGRKITGVFAEQKDKANLWYPKIDTKHDVTINYSDNYPQEIYSGQCNSLGLPHGMGKMKYRDGHVDDGEWINGVFIKKRKKEEEEQENQTTTTTNNPNNNGQTNLNRNPDNNRNNNTGNSATNSSTNNTAGQSTPTPSLRPRTLSPDTNRNNNTGNGMTNGSTNNTAGQSAPTPSLRPRTLSPDTNRNNSTNSTDTTRSTANNSATNGSATNMQNNNPNNSNSQTNLNRNPDNNRNNNTGNNATNSSTNNTAGSSTSTPSLRPRTLSPDTNRNNSTSSVDATRSTASNSATNSLAINRQKHQEISLSEDNSHNNNSENNTSTIARSSFLQPVSVNTNNRFQGNGLRTPNSDLRRTPNSDLRTTNSAKTNNQTKYKEYDSNKNTKKGKNKKKKAKDNQNKQETTDEKEIVIEKRPEYKPWMWLLCLVIIGIIIVLYVHQRRREWDAKYKNLMMSVNNKENIKITVNKNKTI